jgi:Thioredoxin-like
LKCPREFTISSRTLERQSSCVKEEDSKLLHPHNNIMADDESNLAAEIARLEAELERARIESKLQHLKAELNAVEGVVDDDEYLVIQDLVQLNEEDEDYTEHSYEEYDDEEYIEEYEEEIIEEEVTEEYEEEEVFVAEEPAPPVAAAAAAAPVSSRPVYGSLQNAFGNLRKAPVSAYQKKESETMAEKPVVEAPKPIAAPKPEQPKEAPVKKVKAPVRPPPGQGGAPVPRQDAAVAAKPEKKFPLSRLLQRNKKSVDASTGVVTTNDNAEEEDPAKKPVSVPPKKVVPQKSTAPAKKPEGSKKAPAAAAAGGGPFKRRVIPNLQPSPAGQESIFETLLGPKLITNPQLHKCSTKGCVKNQELVGLYFGAVWKSDCKRFNPMLKDFYYNTAAASNLEIIYISADRSLIEFKDCYATMPFLAMPAGTTSIKNDLTKALKIIEMPALVILDDEGSIVTVQGAQKIMELEKGNVEQANQLVDRWKKTRPIPISEVKMDNTLLYGTMERGTVYWQN